MARSRVDLAQSETAMTIYNTLVQFVIDRQTIPARNSLFTGVLMAQGVKITIGSFNHWFDRLIEEGWIEIDDITGSLRIPELTITHNGVRQQKLPFTEIQIKRDTPDYGYVYVLRSQHGCKIGSTMRLEERLSSLKTHYPFPLNLCCLIKVKDWRALEQSLHMQYSHKRITSEWFDLSTDDLDCIKTTPGVVPEISIVV